MTKSQNRNSGRREIPVKEVSEFSLGDDESLRQRIDEKAHEIYEYRGCCHVRGLDDWLEAERLVLSEIALQAHATAQNPRGRARRSQKG